MLLVGSGLLHQRHASASAPDFPDTAKVSYRMSSNTNESLITAELDRALASLAFSRSARARDLLRYLIEAKRANNAGRLKESVIALDVFDRNAATYDPANDGIVRVSVNRLRQVLDNYYNDEGRTSSLRFEIQRGGYTPIIRRVVPDSLPPLPRIAVLPLANFTGDPALAALCDGLTEDLIDAMARIPRIKVIARTSSFRYRDVARDIRAIAKELEVDALLEGSVQLVGEELRVTAQLILGSDGTHLWSHAFESAVDQRSTLQAALIDALARSLDRHDADVDRAAVSIEREQAPAAAHEMIYAARAHRALQSTEAIRMSISLSHEATRLYPNFAAGWESLASGRYALRSSWLASESTSLDSIRMPLKRALEIAPDNVDALSLSGYEICAHDAAWEEGLALCRKAASLAPSNATLRMRIGALTLAIGHTVEADQLFDEAIALDPHAPLNYFWSSMAQYKLHGVDAALERINVGRTRVGSPMIFDNLALSHKLVDQRFAEILPIAEAAATANPSVPALTLRVSQCLAGLGRLDEARSRFQPFLNQCNPSQVDYQEMAIEACGDDSIRVYELAHRAIDAQCPNCLLLPIDPLFKRHWSDPRWHALMHRLNRSSVPPFVPLHLVGTVAQRIE